MSELKHYGVGHIQGGNSGRYPWGSGENPFQHATSEWLGTYRKYKAQGMTEAQMAKDIWPNMTTTEIKSRRAILEAEEKRIRLAYIEKLMNEGKTPTEIGRIFGVNESTIRSLRDRAEKIKHDQAIATADIIKRRAAEDTYIDISAGVESEIGVKRTKFDTAVEMLKDEGYVVLNVKVPQATNPKQKTTIKVLCPPGTTYQEAYKHMLDIKPLNVHSSDGGASFQMVQYPSSINRNRVYIRYKEEGGAAQDGVIELRRNVEDISLGGKSYAQVRIAVDDKYYLKGMAVYSDDFNDPKYKGYDIIVNSNKSREKGFEGAVKELKTVSKTDLSIDKERPFGAVIPANGQRFYPDKNGDYVKVEGGAYEKATARSKGERYSLSPVNILKSEGAWEDYSKTLAAQFLSKQNKDLIKQQINLSLAQKKDQYENIMQVTNPTIRKKLMLDFAEGCDKEAVDLKTTSMPGQCSRVLLPLTHIKDHEVYAPGFENGTTLYLIRYPHAGTFEIPKVVVNNSKRYKDALGGIPLTDAIGVSAKTAAQLSGADFDGDHVMVIPEPKKGAKLKASQPLEGLVDFEPKDLYKLPDDPNRPKMSDRQKGLQMGLVSNLITDMNIAGASEDEMLRAVKHSMVVIDAQKHDLDWRRSEKENNIAALRKKYQKNAQGGATTIVSQSTGGVRNHPEIAPMVYSRVNLKNPPARSSYINPETGEIVMVPTGRKYVDKNGREKIATAEIQRMRLHKDANDLVSKYRNPKELLYAEYANQLKAMANTARKEFLSTKEPKADPSASKIYAEEIASLEAKLHMSERNRPKERDATIMANNIIAAKLRRAKSEGITYSSEEMKKIRTNAMINARNAVGAGRKNTLFSFTQKEWEAIQSNAISPTKLNKLIRNMDADSLYDFALPKEIKQISSSKISRINSMIALGYSQEEIAKSLGISVSTVQKYKKKSVE